MGAQWKHAGRVANANKKGAIVGKLVKEIQVAAKVGDPNPDNNPRLRAAVEAARKSSVTRDVIDRAIKKGAGLLEGGVQYETVVYEGFAPHQVPLIIECLTDNKNRTAADIRVLFRKGQLASVGAVSWMFERMGVVEATFPQTNVDAETVAIEAGAQNFEPLEAEEIPAGHTGVRFISNPTDLDLVTKFLIENKWTVTQSALSYIAKTPVEVSGDQKKEVGDFLESIDEHDDVHRIFVAMK